MDNNKKKNMILITAVILVIIGLVGWIIYSKVKGNEEDYERINIDKSAKLMNYNEYLINYTCEDFDEVCFGYNFDEIMNNLNMKKKDILLTDDTYDEKYELKIENDKVTLYVLNYENDTEIRKKFIFNEIDNPNGIFAYEGVGSEDSFPVDFWVIDDKDNIYYVNILTRYCGNDCGSEIIKIAK